MFIFSETSFFLLEPLPEHWGYEILLFGQLLLFIVAVSGICEWFQNLRCLLWLGLARLWLVSKNV